MHDADKRERRARRKADRKAADSEDTETEEEPQDEMDGFQDIQLGSITPVVCGKDRSPSLSLT
jgi:hypothetical protein